MKYDYREVMGLGDRVRERYAREVNLLVLEVEQLNRLSVGASSLPLWTSNVRRLTRKIDRLAWLLCRIEFAKDEAAWIELTR